MKRISRSIFIIILGLLTIPFFSLVKADNQIDIHFFHNQYCLHCQAMEEYLLDLTDEYDNIEIIFYEISDDENYDLFLLATETFEQKQEVPFVVIGGLSFSGYNIQIEADIEHTIIRYTDQDYVDIVDKLINGETILVTDFDALERETVNLPIIGEVELEGLSLLLSAIVLGFVDGFNPCAMWVLVFLITMLINMQDRKRMWLIGLTFLFTSAFVYFLIMVSWLSIAVSLAAVDWIRYMIGVFAIGFGVYHLYKYFKNRKSDVGCEITDEPKRKKLMERIKNIVKKQNIWFALAGVIALAFTVNMIELACSAGLPLLFTQILAYNDLATGAYFLYIGVYILFFLIDDLIIFGIAMITFRVTGISNKYTKYSTIIGAIIMLLIGVMLIFFPKIIMFNF